MKFDGCELQTVWSIVNRNEIILPTRLPAYIYGSCGTVIFCDFVVSPLFRL